MKKTIITLSLLSAASALSAQVVETFNYSTGALGSQVPTGTGLTGNWGNFVFSGAVGGSSDMQVTSGSISAPTGYGFTPTNNKLVADTVDLGGAAFVTLSSGIDFSVDGTHYLSYLTTAYDNGWTAGYIQFLDSAAATVFTAGELDTGVALGGQLGINAQTSTALMDTNGTNGVGMDNLVVLKIETSAAGNDTISGSFWRSGIDTVSGEPVSWAVSDTFASSATVNFLGFRTQDGFGDLTPAFDEFRIGSSYSTVVPEPSAYALLAGMLALTSVMIRRRK